jgi:hypothetical protein
VGAFVVVWLQQEEAYSQIPLRWIRAAMALILLVPVATSPLGKATGFSVGLLFIIPVFAMLIFMSGERRRLGGALRVTSPT